MEIRAFGVEEWMNKYEMDAKYNIAETCVDSMTLEDLLSLSDNKEELLNKMLDTRLTYGYIEGSDELRENIASLYGTIKKDNVITTNGAIGANFLTLYTLVRPGDEVVSVLPTYQQLYSIPESFGADVKILKLKPENSFLPDLDELRAMVSDKTRVICINNPNNPSGALMDEAILKEIVEIAKSCDAYILADEVYRGLYQDEDAKVPSIVDLYHKGISTGSMSKVFSLAGLRLGWIAASEEIIKEVFKHRDYNIISCGVLDDMLAAHALKNKDKIFERSLKIVRENLEILDKWVENEPHVSYVRPKAGTTAFLKYDLDIPSAEFCEGLLKETGVLLVPGICFDMEGYLRVGYAYGKKDLEEGLEKVSEYIKTLLK